MGLPIFRSERRYCPHTVLVPEDVDCARGVARELGPEQRHGYGWETSVQIDGSSATLTFKAVTRDSRCPTGVRCIRAGEAVVVLELRGGSNETSTLTFEVPPGGGASKSLRGYQIEIVSLDPQAEADVEIAPGDYTATHHNQRNVGGSEQQHQPTIFNRVSLRWGRGGGTPL